MADAKLTLNGDRQLKRLLDELPRRVVKKGLRQAISAAASPIVKDAKAGVKQESGLLKRALTKKIKTYPNGNVIAVVGASKAVSGMFKGRRRVPSNYIALVEKGTKPHAIGKGTHPGTAPSDFLEEAYESNRGKSLGIASDKLAAVLDAEAARGGGS